MLLLMTVLITGLATASQDTLETIELHHALASDLVPVIRPLLPPASALTASGNTLILRTDPDTLQQVKEVIRRLDVPPEDLLITVRNVQREAVEESRYNLSGRISTDRVSAGVGRGPQRDGIRIDAGRQGYSTDLEQVSQLRVQGGHRAFIDTGKSVPYYGGRWYFGGGVVFQDVHQGFFVTPRVQGDRVTLEIQPRNDRLSPNHPGVIDRQVAATTVTGPLGEWITVAGTDRKAAGERRGTAYRTTRSGPESRLIQVKVVRAP